jgi:hypothetical protein
MRINLGSIASSIRKKFTDTFNRADSASVLGTASDGSTWNVIRGTWGISGNAASSSTSPSSYPLATVDMPKQNVQIDLLSTANGTGAGLWVTDSGNWWAIAVDQETVTTYSTCNASNCNAYTNYSGSNCNAYSTNCNAYSVACNSGGFLFYNSSCNTFNTSTCKTYAGGGCSGYSGGGCSAYNAGKTCRSWFATYCSSWYATYCSSWNTANCNAYNAPVATCTAPGNLAYNCNLYSTTCDAYTTYSGSNCNAYFAYTYACNPVTTYPSYIRLYQSLANTVTQIASQTIAAVAQSLRITTNGSQITTKAYSDANQVTQIGSDWIYTPTGVALTPKYGIVVTPTNYSQGSTIGDITIS